jgi:hypothetical protein
MEKVRHHSVVEAGTIAVIMEVEFIGLDGVL